MKKFRRVLRSKKQGVEVYRVLQLFSFPSSTPEGPKAKLLHENDPNLCALLQEFEDVCEEEVPDGLLPEGDVDHVIEILPDSQPPHLPLYELSPAELVAAHESVEKLLRSGTIRPSRSPYGSTLFLSRSLVGGCMVLLTILV